MPSTRQTVSLRALRWQARAPKLALYATAATLSAVGLRDVISPAAARTIRAPSAPGAAVEADGVAERFARVFLTDDQDVDRRAARLAAFGLPSDALTGERSGRARDVVRWTSVVASRASTPGQRVVTVAASVDARADPVELAVPLAHDRRGGWRVTEAPAVVGTAAPQIAATGPAELEVDDSALKATATRVVRHYLATEEDDLSADLSSSTVITPPTTDLRVLSVEAVTWVTRPRRVAVAVVARAPSGRQLRLRYELVVGRLGGRWLVSGLENPTHDREVTP